MSRNQATHASSPPRSAAACSVGSNAAARRLGRCPLGCPVGQRARERDDRGWQIWGDARMRHDSLEITQVDADGRAAARPASQ